MQCDTLEVVFGRYADLFSADMGVRIIYIGLQIFTLWQKCKVVHIIFDGILYSKFYGADFPVVHCWCTHQTVIISCLKALIQYSPSLTGPQNRHCISTQMGTSQSHKTTDSALKDIAHLLPRSCWYSITNQGGTAHYAGHRWDSNTRPHDLKNCTPTYRY